MSISYKVVRLSFLALTLFSIFSASYTIYIFYGIKFAINGLEIQIFKVTVDEQSRQIVMGLKLRNHYWVDLKIKYLSYRVFYNYVEINSGEQFFNDPIGVPCYSVRYLNLTFPLNIDNLGTYGGIWIFIGKMRLMTPLKEAVKEVEISSKMGSSP